MAEFLPAFKATLVHEGFPGFTRDNNGAEVCAGINRAYWPKWGGWAIIDTLKTRGLDRHGINDALKADPRISPLVQDFYAHNFWPSIYGKITSQTVANWLFDHAVNMGDDQAEIFLQRAAGVKDDGDFGPKTLAAVNAKDPDALVKSCHDQAVKFYQDLHKKNPTKYPANMVDRA